MEDEKILIRNASQVVTCSGFEAKKGKAMSDVGIIEDGAVAVSDGIITHVGPTEEVLRQVASLRTVPLKSLLSSRKS